MNDSSVRHGYVDCARGLAVLIMIEAHTMDSWTRAVDRQGAAYRNAMILGGFAAPLFLFLAGLGVALSAESKLRRSGNAGQASRAVQRRGWRVLGLAFLFRLQAYLVSPGSPLPALLKVDILNVMGPSIVGAAVLWGAARSRAGRVLACAGAAAAIAMLTPIVRITAWLDWLPDPVELYFRPIPGRTNFTLFPWAGFVFAGAAAGVLIGAARDPRSARRVQAWLAITSVLVGALGYGTSFLPSIYAESNFWTSSPTFFFLRVGIVTAVLPLAYLWSRRLRSAARDLWSPLEELGRSSLFVYWIHVDIVYGLVTWQLHRSLSLGWAVVAYAVLSLFMLALVILKNRIVSRWKARPHSAATERPSRTPLASRAPGIWSQLTWRAEHVTTWAPILLLGLDFLRWPIAARLPADSSAEHAPAHGRGCLEADNAFIFNWIRPELLVLHPSVAQATWQNSG